MKTRLFLVFAWSLLTLNISSAVEEAPPVEIIDHAQENGHTYYLLSASDWSAAESVATRLGGNLVTINSAAENQFLLDRFGPTALANAPDNFESAFWLGLQDLAAEGTFTWSSGEAATFTNWATDYPKGLVEPQDLVALDASGPSAGFWRDTIIQGEIGYAYFGIVEIPLLENLTINPPEDILSWWPGENTAWDVVGEAGGSMKNADLNGQAAYAQGKVGRTFSFDGVNDHIEAEDGPGLDLLDDFTIEAWIRHTGAGGERCIVSKRNSDNLDVSYSLFLREGALYFSSREGGGPFAEVAGPSIPINRWVHVAVSIAGTTFRFYKDGVSSAPVSYPASRPDTSGIVTIGATVTASYPSGTPDGPFSGMIDELAFYDRALSDAEIDAIFWVGAGGKDRHDPARDFSTTANPNGPWAFGSLNGGVLDPAQLAVFPGPVSSDGTVRAYGPVPGGLPHFSINTSQTDHFNTFGAGGTWIRFSPRQLATHPSFDNRSGVMRWTAAEAGLYAVSATFTGADERPTSTSVFVRHNNTAVFPQDAEPNFLNSFRGDGISMTREVSLLQGDHLAWIVSHAGDASYDNTGVVASVVLLESFGKIENPTWQYPIMTADPPMTGRNWSFHARSLSRPDFPDMTAKIQYSSTPGDADSWTDLGDMVALGSMRFLLDTYHLPVGTFAFRIVTSVDGVGTTYSKASPLYTILDAAPYLETRLDVTSASDPTGETTHRGDLLTYTVRFQNSGAGNYGDLKVRIRYPDNTTTAFPAHAQVVDALTTPGGMKVIPGDHFAWEWIVPAVRPLGDMPYAEARTSSRVVKKGKKQVRVYDRTFFSMPNDPSHGFENEDVLRLHQYFDTPLPPGLQGGIDYYVVNATSGNFQISLSRGGVPLLIKALPSWVGPLCFERTNEWQTRKLTFRIFDPTPAEEEAQDNADLPPINAEGAELVSSVRVLDAGLTEIDSASGSPTTVVNPLRLSIARLFGNDPLQPGDLVTFELTAKNESSLRLGRASLVMRAPRGLAIDGSGIVFMDGSGQPSGPPIDASTGAQVVRPASWSSNPELLEAEIPGLGPDSIPSFEQQARFYLGGFDPGKTQKVRVTCRVQYDWDTDAEPELTLSQDVAELSGDLGVTVRSRENESPIELSIDPATPGSPRPQLSMWISQDATGKVPEDPSVVAVASVDGLSAVPLVPGGNPARGVNEIVYRATYANFGNIAANYVRVWVPVPNETDYVSTTLLRSETRTKLVRRPGKKPSRKQYTVQVPYTVESARILQGQGDAGAVFAPRIVGGADNRWFTCLVPWLEAYPAPGWAKTLEFRVKLKPNTPVGTRIQQTGALVTSRELFYWGGVSRILVSEVVPPARLEYLVDQSSVIQTDGEGNPTGFETLAQRLAYNNVGGVAATGAGIEFEIPPGFTFREARYINAAGTVRTTGITAPAVGAGAGQVVHFNTGTVAPNTGGIAEVLLDYDPDSLPDEDSEPNTLYRFQSQGVFRPFDDSHPLAENSEPEEGEIAELFESPVLRNLTRGIVPNSARTFVGVMAPAVAMPGEEITYRVLVGNHGSSGWNGGGFLYFRIPAGTQYVSAQVAGQDGGTVTIFDAITEPGSGTPAQLGIENPAGIVSEAIALGPHSCVVIDLTVRVDSGATDDLTLLGPVFVHGDAGGSRTCDPVKTVLANTGQEISQLVWEGQVGGAAANALGNASAPESAFLASRNSISRDSRNMSFGGTDMVTVPGHNISLIPLGGGRMVAAGAGNLIGQDGGSIIQGSGGAMVAAGAGNLVAAGAGNLISIDVPGHGLLSGSGYFGQLPQMVAAGAGNIVAAGGLNLVHRLVGNSGNTLIGLDGGSLIGLDGGSLGTIRQTLAGFNGFSLPNGSQLSIAANTGRMVAAGAGNLVGNSGNTLVGNSGNTMVAAGGGNMVAVGGLNMIPASRMVAAGAGNILPTGAGGILPSGAGNMVAAGAGNMVAAGAGNVISVGNGMVAAGAGN